MSQIQHIDEIERLKQEVEHYKRIYEDLDSRQSEWMLCRKCYKHSDVETMRACVLCCKRLCALCSAECMHDMNQSRRAGGLDIITEPVCGCMHDML